MALSADVVCALICPRDELVILSWLIPENSVSWCHSLFNVLRELGAIMMMSPDPCFSSEIPIQSPQQGGVGWVFILSDTTEAVVSLLLSSEKREELKTPSAWGFDRQCPSSSPSSVLWCRGTGDSPCSLPDMSFLV